MVYEKKQCFFLLSVVDTMAIWSIHNYEGEAKELPPLSKMIPFVQNAHDKQISKILKEEREREEKEHPEYHIESIEDQTKQILNP
jgi:hypothetical protein